MAPVITPQATDTPSRQPISRQPRLTSEDWWAVWVGGLLMAAVVFRLVPFVPTVGGGPTRWSPPSMVGSSAC